MGRKKAVSPSTSGIRPRIKAVFTGRNVATRPIPIVVESSDILAARAAAADQLSQKTIPNMPSGPRPKKDAVAMFGNKVKSPGKVNGSTWNPAAGLDSIPE